MRRIVQSGAGSKQSAPGESHPSNLSDREQQVFQLLGCGYGPSQTAEELRVSVKTIESHLARIKRKLHIANARTLRQYAIQCGRSGKSTTRL